MIDDLVNTVKEFDASASGRNLIVNVQPGFMIHRFLSP